MEVRSTDRPVDHSRDLTHAVLLFLGEWLRKVLGVGPKAVPVLVPVPQRPPVRGPRPRR